MFSKSRLSSHLAATYRLFLRGTSAAVLNHSTARKNLRRLYRETFMDAIEVEHRLSSEQDRQKRYELEEWLKQWNLRVDNTLELFLASATNRGLSHRLTRNMGLLTNPAINLKKWDIRTGKGVPSRKQTSNYPYRPLSQVVKLAEGHGNLHLGRLPVKIYNKTDS